LRAWEAHLEEVIGVDDAAVITDAFDRHVSESYLDHALARQSAVLIGRVETHSAVLTGQLTAAWRRDLLLVSVGQFFALAGAVAALVGLT